MGFILDISHHQVPNSIDYDKLAKQTDLVIIRTQYGSSTIDKYYQTHHAEFKKRGVPTASYAWVRGINISDMEKEATDFYNRTKDLNPSFWWLDVEEKSMSDMRGGVSAYIKKLRGLGAKKVGVYVANHLYKAFNLNLDEADAVWIPSYGTNNGQPMRKPDFPCDIWQYTSVGKLDGYNGSLDLSKLNGDKELSYFTDGQENVKPVTKPVTKPSSQPAKTTYPLVKKGDKNKYVGEMQTLLNKYGYGLKIDNDFGDLSDVALRDFQKNNGLKVDGLCGANSWSKLKSGNAVHKKVVQPKPKYPGYLFKVKSPMLHDNNVKLIQQAVNKYFGKQAVKVDSYYGNESAKWIGEFQRRTGLKVDKIVGINTWNKLF